MTTVGEVSLVSEKFMALADKYQRFAELLKEGGWENLDDTIREKLIIASALRTAAAFQPSREPDAWQWLVGDTWHTVSKSEVADPEKYARSMSRVVRPIWTVTPPSPDARLAEREAIVEVIVDCHPSEAHQMRYKNWVVQETWDNDQGEFAREWMASRRLEADAILALLSQRGANADGEAVAWRWNSHHSNGPWTYSEAKPEDHSDYVTQPLYAHPAPAGRAPATTEDGQTTC